MPLNLRTVADIILRFTTDRGSQEAARQAIREVQEASVQAAQAASQQIAGAAVGGLQGVGQQVAARVPTEEVVETVHTVMAALNVDMEKAAELLTDQLGMSEKEILEVMKSAQQGAQGVGDALESTTRKVESASSLWKARMAGFTLMVTGLRLQAFSKDLLSPIQEYIKYAGSADNISQQWLETQNEITDAVRRLGREMATTALPALKAAAGVLQGIADFYEKHPQLASVLTGIGVGGFALGSLMQAVGSITVGLVALKSYSNLLLPSLLKPGLLTNLGSGALGAAVGGGLASIVKAVIGVLSTPAGVIGLGATGGVLGYNLIARAIGAPRAGTILGQTATVGAYYAGSLFGPETAARWGRAIGELTGAIDKLSTSSEKATRSIVGVDALEMVEKFQTRVQKLEADYRKQESEAEREYLRERQRMEEDYRRSSAQEVEDFNRSRAQKIQDFYLNEKYTEAEYYRSRTQKLQKFQQEIRDLEAEHQRELRHLQEDHDARMRTLIEERDALGMVREMEAYERERRQSEEEYQARLAQKNQELAQDLRDEDQAFAIKRQQRIAQFQLDLKRDLEEFQIRQERSRQEHLRALADLQDRYNQERLRRRQAYQEQLQDLIEALRQEYKIKATFTQAELAYIEAAIARVQQKIQQLGGSSPVPSRQTGGYSVNGLMRLHEGEFVLNPQTTSLLERAVSGKLTQEKILSLMSPRGMVYIDNRRFERRLTSEDRAEIRAMVQRDLQEAFS